jgi:hypothetical protein
MEDFLAALYDACPTKVDALRLNRRRVEYGLLPVGLKIHCLNDGQSFTELIVKLGGLQQAVAMNYYRLESASMTLVLPPVGNARSAILFIECIEHFIGQPIFNNPEIQIQVCSPGRLPNSHAGLLTIGYCLGSDILRGYDLDDLATTFSVAQSWFGTDSTLSRGKRITIYDGRGTLERDFEWWGWKKRKGKKRRMVNGSLPFTIERTDVMAASTRVDIRNINLLATMLLHEKMGWYWSGLGGNFALELKGLLREHQLLGLLDAPWIREEDAKSGDDQRFLSALQELIAYAISEALRINYYKQGGGILLQIRNLLTRYRNLLITQSCMFDQRRPT